MAELANVLPVLGAIIVLGAIALGSAVRPAPRARANQESAALKKLAEAEAGAIRSAPS